MKQPLVSIILVTYNSSRFVIETLESCKNQTYNNIELILSDDCSTDNTLEICKEWLLHHRNQFTNVNIIETKINTGIAGNLNRGISASKGEWIKQLNGDDLLLENCIEDNINFIQSVDEEVNVLCSRKPKFKDQGNGKKEIINFGDWNVFFHKDISVKDQIKLRLRGLIKPPHTFFISKSALLSVGGFDEKFQLYEDRPIEYRLLNAGFKFYWLDVDTILYRLNEDSLSHQSSVKIYSNWKLNSFYPVIKKYEYPYLTKIEKKIFNYRLLIKDLTIKFKMNKKTFFNLVIHKILTIPADLISKRINTRILKTMENKYSFQKT